MPGKTIHLGAGSQDKPLEPGKLRVYTMRFCPYAQRVHLVLLAKKIPHDIVYINLKEKPEWYLAKYPAGKVPAIVVNGEALNESLILADFLDETYKDRPLHSQDSIQKAKDRLLIDAFGKVISQIYKCFLAPAMDASQLTPAFDEMDSFEKELNKRGTKFFGGSSPGMVDYMIWPWCERLPMLKIMGGEDFQIPKDRFPKMMEWNRAMIEDEAVKGWYVSPEDHATFIKSHKAGTPNYDGIL
uniref:Glutathione S-transferase n=1 Tax=Apolygus lucorum TaxID=248454 RepID=A0A1B3IQY5_APOLU|nr:glutathione S-transferase [Apolygus lucorum]